MKKMSFLLSLSALLAFSAVSSVSATENVPMSLGVTGGSLVLSVPDAATTITIPSVTINQVISANQSPSQTFHNFNITDARGTGAGWNLQLTTQRFAAGALNLPANRTYLQGSAFTASDFTGITLNSPGKTVLTDGVAFSLLSAAVESGMGSYDFSNLVLGYDFLSSDSKSLKAGSYTSQATLSAVTGP